MMRRAASSIWTNGSSVSGHIERDRGLEDASPCDRVWILRDRVNLHQLYAVAEYFRQFSFHCQKVAEPPSARVEERHEQVDVALRAEVIADDGAESGKLRDAPSFAGSL